MVEYFVHWGIGLMRRVLANSLGDWGSIPGCHTKDSKIGT